MATFSDNFNRADGALGANYTTVSGSLTCNVVSNRLGGSFLFNNANVVSTEVATFAPDQEARGVVTAVNNFDFAGLIVRGDAALGNAYIARFDGREAAGSNQLVRMDAGVLTPIGTQIIDVNPSDTVRLLAEGSIISVYVNDILIESVTDTTYTSGQPGVFYQWEDSNITALDDFFATDLESLPAGNPNQLAFGVGRPFSLNQNPNNGKRMIISNTP